MQYFRITKWDAFQHYKDRNPPWIKLHRDMLHSQTWVMLPDASKALAVACMLLAAVRDNQIPMNPTYIKRAANLTEDVDLEPLFECDFIEVVEIVDGHASKSLADASKVLANDTKRSTETEGEGETETEAGVAKGAKKANGRFHPPTEDEVRSYCQERSNSVSPPAFMAHYEANGWKVGRNPMKCWKAAVRSWEARRDNDRPVDKFAGVV